MLQVVSGSVGENKKAEESERDGKEFFPEHVYSELGSAAELKKKDRIRACYSDSSHDRGQEKFLPPPTRTEPLSAN